MQDARCRIQDVGQYSIFNLKRPPPFGDYARRYEDMPKKENTEENTLDLDQAMAEGMDRFEGELKEAAIGTDTITPEPAGEESPPEDEQGAESEAHSKEEEEEKPKDEDETPPPGEEAAEDPKDKEAIDEAAKKLRFKGHEEAERGYRNLQGEKTRLEQRNKDLEQELLRLQKADEIKAEMEKADQEIFDYSAKRHEEALEAIDALDPDEEDYQAEVGKVWAAKDRDVRRFERENPILDQTTTNEPNQTPGEGAEQEAMGFVSQAAEKAGIDPDDEHFKLVCRTTPLQDHTGKEMSFPEQVDWAINQTRQYKKAQEQNFQETLKERAARKAEEAQDQGLPMGRSAAARTPMEDAPPIVSLDDALMSAQEERRL